MGLLISRACAYMVQVRSGTFLQRTVDMELTVHGMLAAAFNLLIEHRFIL